MARRSREIETIVADTSGRMPDPRSREGLAICIFMQENLPNTEDVTQETTLFPFCLQPPMNRERLQLKEFETMFFLFAVAGTKP